MKDLIILGAGPAGLSASIYASRYNIEHSIIGIEKGGYLNDIHKIENYPGFTSISGLDLSAKMVEHTEAFNGRVIESAVSKIEITKDGFDIKTEKETHQAKNVIYSIGTSCRKLQIPGENEFLGKGVSYCATCDGPFFREKTVIVVGGGNSAAMAALLLAEYAKKVVMVYRGVKMRCAPVYADRIEEHENIDVHYETTLKEIRGDNVVKSGVLCHPEKDDQEVQTDGVFVEVGNEPNCKMVNELGVDVDEKGFIKTSPDQSTSIPGFYAAGDITTNSNGFRQIITASAEGAVAALAVFEKLKQQKNA